ncbi:WD repeat-containing protein 89 [Schistocerca nitens]|uniref:WD repeat-containing protein 89 n=1 Tax=Schistocerca nitens TaxID=7011 RepID=UPI00211939EE|nr:WD repeat-containing protein 89 [Schistocerca nitens]XP_049815633.1 WD repeat-containing protein 89 [Schistocerca nitens]
MTGMKVEGREGTENPMNTDDNVVTNSYKLLDEVAVSLEQKCILHICGQRSGKSVALGLSDYSLVLYDVCNLHRVCSFPAHTSTITDVKFSSKNEHLLYSSSLDGTVKVHDLRSKTCVAELKDDSEGPSMLKPLSSFDFSSDENFGSAGTELFDGDAFVLFWDIRTSKLLGGYWESHTDDITQVRFHPEEKNKLATGSVDGIINVFDISKQCEDDALAYCLNTESSIDKLHWFRGMDSTFNISCITHTEELQLWEIDGASPFAHFTREDIAGILKDDTVDNTYLVNSHNQEDGGLLIIAGYSSLKRQDLSAFSLKKPDTTAVYSVSSMNGNKQEVRGSWYNAKDQVLLTGGEGGFLSLWTRDDESNTGHQTKHFKMKHKSKSKPYQRE